MRNIVLALIAPLFYVYPAFCQKIVDVKADWIEFDNGGLTLYKASSNGNHRELLIELEELYDHEYSAYVYSNVVSDFSREDTGIISVDALPLLSPKYVKDILGAKSFVKSSEKTIAQLQYFNEAFFSLRTYEFREGYDPKTDRSEEQWQLTDTDFYNYFVLRINGNRIAIVLIMNDYGPDIEGVIIPTKTEVYARVDDLELKEEDINSMDKAWVRKFSEGFHYHDSYADLYHVSENRLKDLIFDQDLLQKRFDTLFSKRSFVVGKTKDQYSIFNLKLEEITPAHTRSVVIDDEGAAQLLIKNKVKWLNTSGQVLDKKEEIVYLVCGTVTYVDRQITNDNTGYFLRESIDDMSGEERKPNDYILLDKDEFDEVTFLNSSKLLNYDGNSGIGSNYSLPGNEYNYLIVGKDSKYGLLEFTLVENAAVQTIRLPVEFDSIKSTGYYSPIRFEKDGLVGYYPINKEPRYKELGYFEGAFARFTLPNNKKGWLDLYGNEYEDR